MDMEMEEDAAVVEPQQQQQPASNSSSPLFSRDDKVFAKDDEDNNADDNTYYPATVRKCRWHKALGKWQYHVHYQGWNSRWDKWLTDDRILKDTEQNQKFLLVSGLLQEAEPPSSTTATAAATASATTTTTVSASKKRKHQHHSQSATTAPAREDRHKRRTGGSGSAANQLRALYEDFCELPLTLKTVLMDEMERITRLGHEHPRAYDCPPAKTPARVVHVLPAAVTVQQVLKHFLKKRTQQAATEVAAEAAAAAAEKDKASAQDEPPPPKSSGSKSIADAVVVATPDDVQEFCNGLTDLFQEALPKFLLYPQERPQYQVLMMMMQDNNNNATLSPKKPLAQIYGCEYLLRLFVRLPALMQAESSSNVLNIRIVGPLLADLLVLLQKNRQACFKGSYREPTKEEWTDVEKSVYGASASTVASSSSSHNHPSMELGE